MTHTPMYCTMKCSWVVIINEVHLQIIIQHAYICIYNKLIICIRLVAFKMNLVPLLKFYARP